MVEGMVKKFTRLVAYGRTEELRATLGSDTRKLAWRHLAALGVVSLIVFVFYGRWLLAPAAAVVVLAFAANAFAISASLFRAYDRLLGLGMSATIRAVLALAFSAAFSALAGWQGGLSAEAVSSALVGLAFLFYARAIIRSETMSSNSSEGSTDAFISGRSDGVWLFAAFGVALVPVSFDRLWILHFALPVYAAQYAFCGIWTGAAFTVTSVYVQKLGPDFIRMRTAVERQSILRMSLRHACRLSLLMVVGAAASFVLLHLIWSEGFWLKYQLSVIVVVATLLALSVQVTPIFDWALIALDGERAVFTGSVLFSVSCAAFFAISAYLQLGFTAYMLSFGCARAIQCTIEVVMISRLERLRSDAITETG
ncbi:hypothetical protein BwSH14_03350 [Bradyrhizobium ottawaense]|nr:hypothetical protein BwSH14_03350 [Bradyrhizobium ottawaense]GMO70920.1 hypothetical protein BwSH17_28270 [Bradyrhizobium ottawaense]